MQNTYAPCPQCQNTAAEPVKFTWWGGVLGPKILKHVKCSSCGKAYNGKSGKENTTGIVIYTIAVAAICFGLMFVATALFVIFSMSK